MKVSTHTDTLKKKDKISSVKEQHIITLKNKKQKKHTLVSIQAKYY